MKTNDAGSAPIERVVRPASAMCPHEAAVNDWRLHNSSSLPKWAMHIAAQCWCAPTTSMIEMDSRLALVFAEKLSAERDNWSALVRRCVDALDTHEACAYGKPPAEAPMLRLRADIVTALDSGPNVALPGRP